jgi:hypothetical protein
LVVVGITGMGDIGEVAASSAVTETPAAWLGDGVPVPWLWFCSTYVNDDFTGAC